MIKFFRINRLVQILLLTLPLNANENNRGLEVAKQIRQANEGFIGEISKTKMVIIDAHKREVERLMNIKTIEVPGDGNRSLMTFLLPKDVKGTKMLTWEHKQKNDDQWLYLPSLKRIKRIYGSGRASSFMGSEFTYEDLSSGQEVEKHQFQFLSEQQGKSWTVERRSKSKGHYSKTVITYSMAYMNPVEIKYYNKREELQKIATFSDWKKHLVGRKEFWRADKIEMHNVQTNKRSLFICNDRKFVSSLRKRAFRENSLR